MRVRRYALLALPALAGLGAFLTPRLIQAQKSRNESEAATVLYAGFCQAEHAYRETHDPDVHVYATLDQLLAAKLVGERMRGGHKSGYAFTLAPSTTTPDFLWYATAAPETSLSGDRWFFINHAGVVYYWVGPIAVDPKTCAPTSTAVATSFSRTTRPDWD
jgi:hypothetical protein